uniref:Uncharacterized protein n=1 Tax=viral metagenome TaxID=1070528 RepID=A0A6M3LE82_9ZZZZ
MARKPNGRCNEIHRHCAALLEWWNESSKEQRERGAQWYKDAYAEIDNAAIHCFTNTERAVKAAAVLSQRKSWKHSIDALWKLCWYVSAEGRELPSVGLNSVTDKAVACLRGENALSGPKVEAFAAAILGDKSAAVVDVWMLRAMGWNKNHSPDPGGMYDDLAMALKLAAYCVRVPITDFQATVWLAIRENWRSNGRAKSRT